MNHAITNLTRPVTMTDFHFSLPPFSKIEVFCEADFYGATSLVAKQLKRKSRPISTCSWKHGWGEGLPIIYPEQLLFSGSKNGAVLVHTTQQREFLTDEGYSNVYAVGMPFCYAYSTEEHPERIKQSLLVMPPHVSRYVSPRFDENEYVNAIRSIRSDFQSVVICISGECERQGRWRANFENAGFPVTVGADVFDANALVRMVRLFSSFESVTSPNLGSHIVYAALCGCRISIFGPNVITGDVDYSREPFYQRFPRMLELRRSEEIKGLRNDLKSRFECLPSEARFHYDWAVKESGLNNLRDLDELANILGWDWARQLRRQGKNKLKNLVRMLGQGAKLFRSHGKSA